MEHPTSDPRSDSLPSTAKLATAEYVPARRLTPLTLPGLVSVPPMPSWLRRLFRCTDVGAAS